MTQLVHTVELPVPRAEAFERWMDIETFPEIMETVTRVEVTGMRRSYWEIRLGGIDWEYDAVATTIVIGERVEWTSTTGELELEGRATFEDLPEERSRLTVEIVWKPHSVVERIGALLGDDSRAVARELDNFGAHLAQGAESHRTVAD